MVLLLGVFACSLSVIFLKTSQTHAYWLSAARLLIAAAFLSPLMVIEARKLPGALSTQSLLLSVPGAVMLAVHFITWTIGARMTTAANGTLMVNLTTVVMPIVMWLMNRERVNRGEIVGGILAMSGVAALVGSQYELSPQGVRGDLICFGSMCLFCVYLAFSRRLGMGRSLWLYIVPLYAISGLICALIALVTRAPFPTLTPRETTLLLCLGLVPTVIGHTVMNWCMKTMRGPVVSTANLFQFAFSGVTAYILFRELPAASFYPVCGLIIAGSVIVILSHRSSVDVDVES
ncbi:MAG: DMT family transporter [Burkholderiales bacterium]|nr:DMT family transporter [Phycisphaerae bacterium]